LPRGYSCWSMEFSNRVKSSTGTCHLTSTVPLFAAMYHFYARLYKCKTYSGTGTDTQRIAWA
jgi:hypothetical protein